MAKIYILKLEYRGKVSYPLLVLERDMIKIPKKDLIYYEGLNF